MPQALQPRTIELVKATIPALQAHGLAIVQEMYARLFETPHIRALFNASNQGPSGAQPKALTAAILAYAANIENPGVLSATVERIAQKHVGLQIQAEHYPFVADALLGAIKAVLGDAATDEILAAWGEAYWFLANLLIEREHAIYTGIAGAEGGWTGWRNFVVESRVAESDSIASFVLRPEDAGKVLRHKPGQYLTLLLERPGQQTLKRNYSVSAAADGATYRISVKREPGGAASNWIHDHIAAGTVLRVGPPAGEFFLADEPKRPVVLLSGGVGLTPMVSMLETLAARHPHVPVQYVHGTLNGSQHAMGHHVRKLAAVREKISATVFYLEPRAEDLLGQHYDHRGMIGLDWLRQNTPIEQADYFLCGPKPFLRAFVRGLAELGVSADRIHYEFFGPAEELQAA